MPTKLLVTAANWENKNVPCKFAVTANGVALAAVDPGKQIYELPAGTTTVEVTATPTRKSYWETKIELAVAGTGTVSPPANRRAWVSIVAASMATAGATLATIKLSRLRDATGRVNGLLNGPMPPRQSRAAPTEAELKGTYGTWPPGKLDVQPRPTVDYLDAANPVTATAKRELNFAQDASLKVDVETVALELAGVAAPRLLGVTWPKVVERKDGASPTPFLLFVRQTGGQDRKNVFLVKDQPYPFNFDYAERCLFESMHYPPTPLFYSIGWTLRPKGVPYQVAKSGAKAVTVFPVAHVNDGIGYGVLADMDQTGKLLAELQAFMFWQAGIATPPASVGSTAIATYSSANYLIADWLTARRNVASTFLNNTVRAIYFLDPPDVGGCVQAGRSWARRGGSDKRVRLYSRDNKTTAFRTLLELDRRAPALPAAPFFVDSADKKRTVACLPTPSWVKWVKTPPGTALEWWDTHHFIPATVLTHALAQGDL